MFADAIAKVFPWYMRMHRLMGTSPIVDRSAMAHSNTTLNLGAIMHGHKDRGSDDELEIDKVRYIRLSLLPSMNVQIGWRQSSRVT